MYSSFDSIVTNLRLVLPHPERRFPRRYSKSDQPMIDGFYFKVIDSYTLLYLVKNRR